MKIKDKAVIIDVDYRKNNTAVASAIVFDDFKSDLIINSYSIHICNVYPYEPGAFYKRELPCILKVLEMVKEDICYIIIDGYVYLSSKEHKGLGMHLSDTISNKTSIIGIAKNQFSGISDEHAILRGSSNKPLYITSNNLALSEAKEMITLMHGENRLPSFVKLVDQMCRTYN